MAEAKAVARALAGEGRSRLDRRILEELIYERVRVSVDLCELMAFELDLAASIDRALCACSESPDERREITMDLLERAWDRVSGEVMDGIAERQLTADVPAPKDVEDDVRPRA